MGDAPAVHGALAARGHGRGGDEGGDGGAVKVHEGTLKGKDVDIGLGESCYWQTIMDSQLGKIDQA